MATGFHVTRDWAGNLRVLVIAAAFGLLFASPALAFVYSAPGFQGWVVDADNGRPVEGVIVVAYWQLDGGFEGGTPLRELAILETVSDQNGRYQFAGWGPKFALMGRTRSESPGILMFKPGYRYQRLNNEWWNRRDTTKSDWDGKTVRLQPFKGTLAQYAEEIESLNSDLWNKGFDIGRNSGDYCGWRSFPRMLRALDQLENEFAAAQIRRGTVVSRLKANEAGTREHGCGTVSDLLRGVQK